jgi:formate/nitrite transporter FocA (FNT family)
MNDSAESLFFLGVFCGILMFIAVDGYAKTKNPIILFLGVAAFILCGFEHCIADMFYFSVAGMWSTEALRVILTITVGNAVGGMLITLIKKLD